MNQEQVTANNRQALFETLPIELREQYLRSPLVQMHVLAFISGRCPREEMMERLAVASVQQNALLMHDMEKYLKWFGSPPLLSAGLWRIEDVDEEGRNL